MSVCTLDSQTDVGPEIFNSRYQPQKNFVVCLDNSIKHEPWVFERPFRGSRDSMELFIPRMLLDVRLRQRIDIKGAAWHRFIQRNGRLEPIGFIESD